LDKRIFFQGFLTEAEMKGVSSPLSAFPRKMRSLDRIFEQIKGWQKCTHTFTAIEKEHGIFKFKLDDAECPYFII
jgi:hypothetical protein